MLSYNCVIIFTNNSLRIFFQSFGREKPCEYALFKENNVQTTIIDIFLILINFFIVSKITK